MIELFKIISKMVNKLKILANKLLLPSDWITFSCCIKMNQSATIVYVYVLASFALIKKQLTY